MFELTVSYDGGAVETVRTLPIDLVMWERHADKTLSDLRDGIGMGDLTYLAWSASRRNQSSAARAGSATGDHPPFDVWLARIVDLDFEEIDTDQGPTQPAASDGSSSS